MRSSLSSTSFATVLANDLEVDGESLSATFVDEPSKGEVTLFNNNEIFVMSLRVIITVQMKCTTLRLMVILPGYDSNKNNNY